MARPRSDIAPRILQAARARFLAEGVDGASLRAIAEDAGTNIGMVYYYFQAKETLFLAVIEETYVGLLASLEQVLAPSIPARERLRGLYTRVGSLRPDEATMLRLVLREALTSPARLGRLIDRFRRGHVPLLIRLVQDAVREGLFDPGISPALLLAGMLALGGPGQLIMRLAPARLGLGAPPGAPEIVEGLVAVLLSGVGARAPAVGPAPAARATARPRRGRRSRS
jgi:AcrR family transcriptional regulator